MRKIYIVIFFVFLVIVLHAQNNKDKAVFQTGKAGYYATEIMPSIEKWDQQNKNTNPSKSFRMDMTGMNFPKTISDYKSQWHTSPVSQGNTNTCWSYSTTSFFESEVYRISKKQVRLSEMWVVYWEYIEKTRRYVDERGNSAIAEGSEANAVTRICKKYGIVPREAYSGYLPGQVFPNHGKLIQELKNYLEAVKRDSRWDMEIVLANVKSILNFYMGCPPEKVKIAGKEMSPQDYLKNELKLVMNDYVDILSYTQEPFWNQVEYKVPDNWWHDASYYNVPLKDYMQALKNAIRNGYTIGIGGDVSEPGFNSWDQVALIPDFDIPYEYINDDSRQFRFSNQTTQDDHGMHIVGYLEKDGRDWYLVKDSGSGSRNVGEGSPTFGYYFFREDYVMLKMMDFIVHKDAVKDLMKKFNR